MVPIDIGLQGIESALISCEITRNAACGPLIAPVQRSIQLILIPGDIRAKPVELRVIVMEIAMILAQVLVLIIPIAVVAVFLSKERSACEQQEWQPCEFHFS